MKVSVLICTYNRAELLKEALDSLVRLDVPPALEWEILVVDNNSDDCTKTVIHSFCEKYPSRFRYIFEGRRGKSFALNTGIRETKGELIAFTDDDVIVDPQWLTQLVDTTERFDCAGIGGKIVPVWKIQKPSWLEMDGPHRLMDAIVSYDLGNQSCQMSRPPFGANMAIRKTILEKYGDFRSDLGPGVLLGGEDTEYCRRIIRDGDRMFYAPGAIVFHPVEEKRTHKSYFERWYFCRGRAAIREGGVPRETVRYFKVPRYMLWALSSRTIKWLLSPNPKQRFHNKLEICEVWGQIVEARAAFRLAK